MCCFACQVEMEWKPRAIGTNWHGQESSSSTIKVVLLFRFMRIICIYVSESRFFPGRNKFTPGKEYFSTLDELTHTYRNNVKEGHTGQLTLNELCTSVSSKSMTTQIFPASFDFIRGSSGIAGTWRQTDLV